MTKAFLALVLAMSGSAALAAETIKDAQWIKRPSESDLMRVYPPSAVADGRSGTARVRCRVTAEGRMDACVVAFEDPPGAGFGDAAVRLAAYFQMSPTTPAGRPVAGGVVELPIFFRAGSAPLDLVNVLNNGPWAETPTAADVAAAFPAQARGVTEHGHVVLRCKVQPAGSLTGCTARSEAPADKGFKAGALQLASKFRLQPEFATTPNLYVDVPIDLSATGKAGRIANPMWTRSVHPDYAAQVFPKQAIEAGLSSGRGAVQCEVNSQGGLADCTVVREEPEGYGFGQAAVSIAATMAMNPWTNEGAPVEGQRVELPIRISRPEAPKTSP